MWMPKYRCGQLCLIPSYKFDFKSEFLHLTCKVLFPIEDGTYFLRVLDTGGYFIAKENDMISHMEYEMGTQQHPYFRPRIVFFGNGKFAAPTLGNLLANGYDVAAVVTMEDKPCGRGREPRPSEVKMLAEGWGIPVFQPRKLDSQRFLKKIRNLRPTLGVVVEYRKLPEELFTIPSWGCINLHSSLLPMYRGASTIASAIKDDQTFTGVTVFQLDKTIDTGRIINNYAIRIGQDDTAGKIFGKLAHIGAQMVEKAIMDLNFSKDYDLVPHLETIPQEDLICDFIHPSRAPKFHRDDCIVPWHKSAAEVINFIRAYNPIPMAWTRVKMLGMKEPIRIKIHKVSRSGIGRGQWSPGELQWRLRNIFIACKDELLAVELMQLPGKKPMTALEFFNGFRGACKGFCELPITIPGGASDISD